jgi:spore maturation protein B
VFYTKKKEKEKVKIISIFIPLTITILFIYASIKKVKIYDSFAVGAKEGLDTVFSILPYLITIFVLTELFSLSGLSSSVINLLTPVLKFLGIPPQLAPLVILKPFSGSGSIAVLSEIFSSYGADGYVARCACAVFGSSETTFYVTAVYYVKCKNKNAVKGIIISLTASFITTCLCCLVCRFLV